MVYHLRFAVHHERVHDSWRIIVRLDGEAHGQAEGVADLDAAVCTALHPFGSVLALSGRDSVTVGAAGALLLPLFLDDVRHRDCAVDVGVRNFPNEVKALYLDSFKTVELLF